jgi:hypothetical protein
MEAAFLLFSPMLFVMALGLWAMFAESKEAKQNLAKMPKPA